MFNIGFPELVVILVIALLVIGPKKLPELAKTLGKTVGDFQKSFNDIKTSVEKEIEDAKTHEPKDGSPPPKNDGHPPST